MSIINVEKTTSLVIIFALTPELSTFGKEKSVLYVFYHFYTFLAKTSAQCTQRLRRINTPKREELLKGKKKGRNKVEKVSLSNLEILF